MTSNAGLNALTPAGAIACAPDVRHLVGIALLDLDVGAGRGREIDRRRGRGDVERDLVLARRDREPVGADLVRDVAVRGDAIGADDHEVDQSPAHQRRGRAVGDERRVDAEPVALPHREPRALQQRSRLVDPQPRPAAGFERGAHDAERGAVADARERAGVAVRQHRAADRNERGAVRADRAGCGARRRPRSPARASSAASRPPRSYASRPCATPHARLTAVGRARAIRAAAARTCRFVRSVRAASATPNAPAAPSAGAPRTASVAIAVDQRVDVGADDEPQPRRQRALIEQPDRVAPPLDRRRDRFDAGHASRAEFRWEDRAAGSSRDSSERSRPFTPSTQKSPSSSCVRIQKRSLADRVAHLAPRPRRAACPSR